jgi:hypothetical protein
VRAPPRIEKARVGRIRFPDALETTAERLARRLDPTTRKAPSLGQTIVTLDR